MVGLCKRRMAHGPWRQTGIGEGVSTGHEMLMEFSGWLRAWLNQEVQSARSTGRGSGVLVRHCTGLKGREMFSGGRRRLPSPEVDDEMVEVLVGVEGLRAGASSRLLAKGDIGIVAEGGIGAAGVDGYCPGFR